MSARVRSRDVWVVLLNTTALALGLVALWQLRTIVAWVLVSLFLALALRPLVLMLTRRGVRRGLAVAIVGVAVLGVLGGLIAMLIPLAIEQGRGLLDSSPEMIAQLSSWEPVRWTVSRFGDEYSPASIAESLFSGAADHAFRVARTIVESLIGAVTIAAMTLFMLLTGDELIDKGLAWIAPERREHARDLMDRMTKVVGGYITGTFVVASIGGVVMGITLALLGVPYFLALGLTMIVLGIIPYLGSLIGAVLMIGVTMASQGWKQALICAAVYVIYQQIENEVLQPIVQRRTIHMNVLLIVIALLVGTALAGIVGALLALPIAGAIQVALGDVLAHRRKAWGEHPPSQPDEPTPGQRLRARLRRVRALRPTA